VLRVDPTQRLSRCVHGPEVIATRGRL
jgi:hypothetical protein